MLWFLVLAASATPAAGQRMSAVPVAAVVDHIALQVANPSASADFYQRVLELSPFPQQVSQSMRWLGSGTFQLHLIGGRTKPVDTATDTHFAFRVVSLVNELQILDRNHVVWSNSGGATQGYNSSGRSPASLLPRPRWLSDRGQPSGEVMHRANVCFSPIAVITAPRFRLC